MKAVGLLSTLLVGTATPGQPSASIQRARSMGCPTADSRWKS